MSAAEKPVNEFQRITARVAAMARERESDVARELEARRRHDIIETRRVQWSQWGLPDKFINLAVDPDTDTPRLSSTPMQAAASIEARTERPVIRGLSGPIGCGKTTAACHWLVNETIARTRTRTTGRQYRTAEKIESLSRYNKGEGMPRELEHAAYASALVIDDLHDAPLSDNWVTNFHALIDTRYRHNLPTFLIGNVKWDVELQKYWPQTRSRIMADRAMLTVNGPNLRSGAFDQWQR